VTTTTQLMPAKTDAPAMPETGKEDLSDFFLDVSFVEVGDTVKDLIYMTNDNCGSTCQSACTSC
jgi:FxLD family lantipeptide